MSASGELGTVLGAGDPEMNETQPRGCEGLTVWWRRKGYKQSLIAGVMQGMVMGVSVGDHGPYNRTEYFL